MTSASSRVLTRRRLLCGCAGLLALGLAGCGRDADADAALAPQEPQAQTGCELDGMLLAGYPGPKGQLRYKGRAGTVWFCDATELLSTLIAPEQVRPVAAAWVQDMARADWERPVGHWIDARSATFVVGGRRHGSMGPTSAGFASAADAQGFAARNGGRVFAFADIRAEDVDLSGGVRHDGRM
ncbi:MAG: nitrous oxide reductase accessory protein NosL [Comamonadaceae bacterium]|nr:nitrous oxide reductase accessory protein NosL [Comamonadaceae bacterium]